MKSARKTRFQVSGMKCGGCSAKAREMVLTLTGVTDANFDHQTGNGWVSGEFDPQTVIKALASAGYTATIQPG